MKLEGLIKTRRTIHSYTDEPVALELLHKSLELALYAPNHRHTKPWKFYLVDQKLRQQIAEFAIDLKSENKELTPAMCESLKSKYLKPAHLVVLGCVKSKDPIEEKENYASVACGVQNISLYLWDYNVGTKWSSGAITRHKQIYDWLNIDRDHIELVGFLWVGVAEQTPRMPEKQKLELALVNKEA